MSSTDGDYDREVALEQDYVDGLFARLDDEVAQANERLRQVQLEVDPTDPDSDALILRETEYHGLNQKLDRLNVAQLGLVFGRIDLEAPDPDDIDNPVPGQPGMERRYIGRLGLDDRHDGYRTLLLDWRAPMARPFYLATTARPEGVSVRRHIRTQGRTVTGVDDEVLSGDVDTITRQGVGSETALYHAMQQARTGHMQSIVETIQREQDEIIRDDTRGVMVVQGGPGTGKTAVALHRVAYLLYTHREQLAKTGVLIVGPNTTFLEYISRVLPELGETGVVLSTIGQLYPDMTPTADEPLLSQEVKGSAEMVTILRRWVRHHQRVPLDPVELVVDGIGLQVTPAMVTKARTRARRSRRAHNDARALFAEVLTGLIAAQLADRIGADVLGGDNLLSQADVDQLHDELAEDPSVNDLIDQLWPELEPMHTLRELLESAEAIGTVAGDYDEETQSALLRPVGSGWAATDAALLDELAVLIGVPDPEEAREKERKAWREQVSDAEDALDILASSASTDTDDDGFEAEVLSAHDVIDAETLARRQQDVDVRSTADRAREDHTWAYGHIIVDEAQELTPMEWRMIFRRSPACWMTLVGDTAQTGSPAGTDSWADTLDPFIGQRYRLHELTVNYRTPTQVMEVANRLLKVIDPEATPATAIRSTDYPVRYLPSGTDPAELKFDKDRLVAVVDKNNVAEVKGLEFDHVVVVEPQEIVANSPQGWQDLYVAITRATQSLTVIGEVPATT